MGLLEDIVTGPLRTWSHFSRTPPDNVSPQPQQRSAESVVLPVVFALASSVGVIGAPAVSEATSAPIIDHRVEDARSLHSEKRRGWNSFVKAIGQHSAPGDLPTQLLRAVDSELVRSRSVIPSASVDEEGTLLVYWDHGPHHLEVECFSDSWEWFYLHTGTDRMEGEEGLLDIDLTDVAKRLTKNLKSVGAL